MLNEQERFLVVATNFGDGGTQCVSSLLRFVFLTPGVANERFVPHVGENFKVDVRSSIELSCCQANDHE